ncbi:methyltransferase domain-containing protein [Methanonatronarchaeum sp. AMET6-2]|uniref:bifunctional cobalt-precorrin-7 (C(5))-methyltransferase/cobalt-precorrin-6B (C(15))-methyltransferase n=1 Tax=Methanonatronarchaeum sp. AMET6-2 TaxID=2933293 RepID=UPI00122865B9|nr:methyltransferase domain-containing protein [Methanonatronarchaeum sp. AMET6-2]RZN63422.1 MAG: methyltransferase domain-containing protein [Methanonatronarchaeia archaeon]UOY10088.1 methyltransferase domain-containing protein [Methanonatronarchaeum sp. AMET6-2]
MTLKGTPTKEEAVGIVIQKLNLKKNHRFLDIGSGSGAISKAASKITKNIHGIDIREKAVELSRENCPEGKFHHGDAAEIIPKLGEFDRIFIGGTKNIDSFFTKATEKLKPNGIIIANAARIETTIKIQQKMKQKNLHKETIMINIARNYDLAGETAFKPQNPVFMVVGKC